MQNLSNENDTIQLCGLLWDALNFSKYLDLETAWDIGETIGKRLPTAEEWQALCDLGSTWDDERKGRWFGGNHDTDRRGSLFLPADGVRHSYNDEVGGEGTTGYYWSSEDHPEGHRLYKVLFFDNTETDTAPYLHYPQGCSIRFVQDL
ncbi:fibrobacter succinogenes major paralogous domain-containing protein [Alistipes indistinctus]|uniref:hypothetical protein n=1 Tax=Alistipes indistinctus TaxID=626932 RepID=UPI0015F1E6B1|nr:hypothetical protein [Alistipes indistinctus]BCD55449.1 hypothetical protein AI2BBH_P470 [Alistipes indistinctus]